MTSIRPSKILPFLAAVILFVVVFCPRSVFAGRQEKSNPGTNSSATSPSSSPAQVATGSQASGYVGSEVCESCHEDIYKAWEKSPHWKTTLNIRGGPSHQGCEGCHGPGEAHVAGGGDITKIYIFTKQTAKEVDARCLTCHAGGQQHMNALNSVHAQNGVSCISCHSIHHATTAEYLLAKSQPALCYQCHLAKKAEFAMPFHHRVNEGLIQCTDCHNVHGTEGPKQVRASSTQNAICVKCHTDNEGPFVYEHAAVKVEGCTSCHAVHGSPNAHLLKVANVNMLCLQCHTASSFSAAPGTPSFHNQTTFFEACTLCHVQIHGSNFNQYYFQ
jgi:DmsE family decaheme c-type cytochrome